MGGDASASRLTVVIGASEGLGRHLSLRAASRGDGVVAAARTAERLTELASHSENIRVVVGDVLAGEGLAEIRDLLAAHAGRKSLVITAATIGPVGRLIDVEPDEWAAAITTNVSGTARVLSRLMPVMTAHDLVVVFSGGGVGGPSPQPNVSSYTTSKAALMHLIEVVARESDETPSVVAIAPGAFPTRFTDPVLDADPEVAGPVLLADVEKTKSARFDATNLDSLLDHLESHDVRWLSGRSLSARWENPTELEKQAGAAGAESPDLYRLRRVDGVGVTVTGW